MMLNEYFFVLVAIGSKEIIHKIKSLTIRILVYFSQSKRVIQALKLEMENLM